MILEFEERPRSFSTSQGTRSDASRKKRKRKTRNCTKGYPCGNSCINRSLKCRRKFNDQASTYAGWLKKNASDKKPRGDRSGSKKVRQLEDKIRLQRFESAAVFNAFGEQILFKDGAATSVDFTGSEVFAMKGGVLTHNHPTGWDYPEDNPRSNGNSFSEDDMLLATNGDLAEIRAVSRGYRHSLIRPEQGWGDLDRMDFLITEADAITRKDGYALINSAKTQQEQDEFLAIAESRHWHEVVKIVADRIGAKYTREKYKPEKE